MIDALNRLVLTIMDALMGWSLGFPRGLVLIVLACVTAQVIVMIRKWKTDQNLLARVATDKKRLKVLVREAKSRGDKETVGRLRITQNQVAQKGMWQELKPLLYVLPPMLLLTTWMWQRMAFIPTQVNEEWILRAELPAAAEGKLVHLVPDGGLKSTTGWLKFSHTDLPDADSASVNWRLRGEAGQHKLTLRYEGKSYEHSVALGEKFFSGEVTRAHDDRLVKTELVLQPYKPFGFVPGMDALGLAPWMVAYLAISFICVPLFKRLNRVS